MFKKTAKTEGGNFFKEAKIKKIFIILVVFLAIGGTITSVYYFKKYSDLKANPNLEAQKETESLVNSLGKLMELPTDETPIVATVLDIEKLKDQPFFAKAQNGDKLLAYTKARQAILYRPSANKIINVAPLMIDQQEQSGIGNEYPFSQAPQAITDPKIAYYNGTETVGLSGQDEKIVKNKYPDSQTTNLTNASKKDYQGYLVIDLSGKFSNEVNEIASILGGEVVSMPEGETVPNADILIISGQK